MQLEKIKVQVETINHALSELENGGSIAFFKALIQKTSIEMYELTSHLEHQDKQPEKSKPNIQIISQSEILKNSNPEKTEPLVPEIIGQNHKTPAAEPTEPVVELKHPEPVVEKIIETPIQNTPVIEPKLETQDVKASSIHIEISTPKTKIELKSNANNKPLLDPDDDSLNAKLSKSIKPVINIVEKSKETPIKDLVKSISISKKFEFIKVLFNGNSEAYKLALNAVQNAGSYEEAIQYLQNNVTGQYDWTTEESEELAHEFYGLLRRRHM